MSRKKKENIKNEEVIDNKNNVVENEVVENNDVNFPESNENVNTSEELSEKVETISSNDELQSEEAISESQISEETEKKEDLDSVDSNAELADKNVSNKKSKKEKKAKKEKRKFSLRTSFVKNIEKQQSSIGVLFITCLSAFLVMAFVAFAVFFHNVKGPEKVLVPNVVGKELEDALLEMQVKELYPKINLRYSDIPGDDGTILEQTPEAGAIVKGYSRVSLVVSRGILVNSVGDYVGQILDDVILKLEALFAGQATPLIKLDTPQYKPDSSPAGTILEQNPPAGTSIYEPVKVQLVVSRGPNYENTRAPYVVGQTINDLMQTISRSKIVFEISSHEVADGEKPGVVTSQQKINTEFVPNYSRVTVEMAMPKEPIDGNYYGIFTKELVDYPYPVPMKLTAIPAEGEEYTIIEFNHTGGKLTIPYSVPSGTTLVLTVADKVNSKQVIN